MYADVQYISLNFLSFSEINQYFVVSDREKDSLAKSFLTVMDIEMEDKFNIYTYIIFWKMILLSLMNVQYNIAFKKIIIGVV